MPWFPRSARRLARLLLPALLASALLVACGDGTPASRDATSTGPPAPAETIEEEAAASVEAGTVFVVQLVEHHEDAFGEDLPEVDRELLPRAIRLVAGTARVRSDLMGVGDPAVLETYGTRTVPAGTPLGECQLVVFHIRRYVGRARHGEDEDCIAFAEREGAIRVGVEGTDGTFVYDPATDEDPLPLALRRFGGLDARHGTVRLRVDPDEALLYAACGDREHRLASGEPQMIAEGRRRTRVEERGLTSADIEWSKPPTNPEPFELIAPRQHGEVEFSTRLVVSYLGVLPRVHAPVQEEER